MPRAQQSPDVLSRAIDELRVHDAVYQHDLFAAPWSRALAGGAPGVVFVRRGAAQLVSYQRVVDLAPGDLVIIAAGAGHVESVPGVPAGAASELIVGRFELGAIDHPLFEMLPAFLHMRADQVAEIPQLGEYLHCLAAEVARPREGSTALVARLSDVVLIEALRHLATTAPECAIGAWLVALRDPALAVALRALHQHPEKRWTIAKLAGTAGLSRAAFADRFSTVMGEPPMTYFMRWRMFRARTLLRDTARPIEDIAREVGYSSAAAFSFAFHRLHGRAPTTFRRAATEGSWRCASEGGAMNVGDPIGT